MILLTFPLINFYFTFILLFFPAVFNRTPEEVLAAKGVKPTLSPNLNTLALVEVCLTKLVSISFCALCYSDWCIFKLWTITSLQVGDCRYLLITFKFIKTAIISFMKQAAGVKRLLFCGVGCQVQGMINFFLWKSLCWSFFICCHLNYRNKEWFLNLQHWDQWSTIWIWRSFMC